MGRQKKRPRPQKVQVNVEINEMSWHQIMTIHKCIQKMAIAVSQDTRVKPTSHTEEQLLEEIKVRLK